MLYSFYRQRLWNQGSRLIAYILMAFILSMMMPNLTSATVLQSPSEEMKNINNDWREEDYLRARHMLNLKGTLLANKGQQLQESLERIDRMYDYTNKIIDAFGLLVSLKKMYTDTQTIARWNEWKDAAAKMDPNLLMRYGKQLSTMGIAIVPEKPELALMALSWTAFLADQASSKGVLDSGVLNLNLADKNAALLDLAQMVTQDNIQDDAAWYEKAGTWSAVQKAVIDSLGEVPAALRGLGGTTGYGTFFSGSLVKWPISYLVTNGVKLVATGFATHYVITGTDQLCAQMLALEFLDYYYGAYRGNKHAFEVALGKPDNTAFSWSLKTLVFNFMKATTGSSGATFSEFYENDVPLWLRGATASTGSEPVYQEVQKLLLGDPNLMLRYSLTPARTYRKDVPTQYTLGDTIAISVQLDPLLTKIDDTSSMAMKSLVAVGYEGFNENTFTTNVCLICSPQHIDINNININDPMTFKVSPEISVQLNSETPVKKIVAISRPVAVDPTKLTATSPTILSATGELGIQGPVVHLSVQVPEIPFSLPGVYAFRPRAATPLEVCVESSKATACATATASGQTLDIELPVDAAQYHVHEGSLALKIKSHLLGVPYVQPFTTSELVKDFDVLLPWSSITIPAESPAFQILISDPKKVSQSGTWTSLNLVAGETFKVCMADNDLLHISQWTGAQLFVGRIEAAPPIMGTIADGCAVFTAPQTGFLDLVAITNTDNSGPLSGEAAFFEDYYVITGGTGTDDSGGSGTGTGTPGVEYPATRLLNDTGVQFCGDAANGNHSPCVSSDPVGQDAHYGRDVAAAAGQLTKVGGGDAGFDFTKIANSGAELPASAALGSGPNDWACTRDNVTGLLWEVKTGDNGLRDKDHTYTWYNSNPATNGGNVGTAGGGACYQAGRCDTEKYVADVNSQGLCGHNDWRMPATKELQGIVDGGRTYPSIDPTYFPNTPNSFFWSGSANAYNSGYVWYVNFDYGYAYFNLFRSYNGFVRLVRGGQ